MNESKAEVKGSAVYARQRQHCLDHARDLIASAERVLGQDNAHANIAYHLAILALEEIGKAGMVGSRAAVRGAWDATWLEKRMGEHAFKLMWAIWSPRMSGKLDPQDFIEARQFAESTHERRMAGLYVDYAEDGGSAPPREAVRLDHATSILNLAKARLAMEVESDPSSQQIEGNEDLDWFLSTVSSELGKKRLFSPAFIDKHEELKGNTRAWVQWARGEFDRIKAEEDKYLQQELVRQRREEGIGKPKWVITIRVQTPSHSLRQKVLNHWNDRIDFVKLRAAGGKSQSLLLELSVHDGVPLEHLFDTGLAWSKRFLVMLNIGSAGFFWYELSGQSEAYYDSVRDVETNLVPLLTKRSVLSSEWSEERGVQRRQRIALEEAHMHNAIMCLAAFGFMPDVEAEPIFGPYLHGLTLLSKADIHLSIEGQARDAFLNALRAAMTHFGDLKAEDADMLPALHRVIEPVLPEEEHRNILFESVNRAPEHKEMLSAAVSAKRVADLYLTIVAKRLWPDVIERRQKSRKEPAEG
jgi:AbiV family abortive infection protein